MTTPESTFKDPLTREGKEYPGLEPFPDIQTENPPGEEVFARSEIRFEDALEVVKAEMVKGIDSTRSVEMSRCYECGTPLIRPLPMPPSAWLPFTPTRLHLIPTAETDVIG